MELVLSALDIALDDDLQLCTPLVHGGLLLIAGFGVVLLVIAGFGVVLLVWIFRGGLSAKWKARDLAPAAKKKQDTLTFEKTWSLPRMSLYIFLAILCTALWIDFANFPERICGAFLQCEEVTRDD